MSHFLRRLLVLLLGLTVSLWFPTSALAANFVVTRQDDPAPDGCNSGVDCSLREAIIAANVGLDSDTITLPVGIHVLSIAGQGEGAAATGDLDITTSITITGAGSASSIVDGAQLDRVFDVLSGGSLTISGITVRNGSSGDANGGGIRVSSNAGLTVTDSTITQNQAQRSGGGIVNSGTLTMSNSAVSANVTLPIGTESRNGGGIANFTGATMNLTGVTITGNNVIHSGGGVSNSGTGTITGGTISMNTTPIGTTNDRNGGGVSNFSTGNLTLTNVAVANNTAGRDGGGIANSGTLILNGGTSVTGNQTGTNAADTSQHGGGVRNFDSGQLTIQDATISSNTAFRSGGGIGAGGNVQISSTTISSNTAGTSGSGGGGGVGGFVSVTVGITTSLTLNNVTVSSNTAAGGSGGGISAFGADLTVTGGTIQNNSSPFDGAGIAKGTGTSGSFTHTSQATITNTLIKDNHGTTAGSDGGGIVNSGGPLEIRDSTIEDNDVLGFGGGIGNFSGAVTTVFNTTIRNNEAAQAGGGITHNNLASTSLTLTDSTVSGNKALSGSGGGLIVGSNSGTVTLLRSTFSGNTGVNSGGLSIGSGSTLTATNSTISTNSASQTGGGIGTFGAVTLTNVTFHGNQASQAGAINRLAGTVNARNSIFANSTGGNCSGGVSTQGNNLEFPGNTCGLSAAQNDLINIDPQLGALANNGGTTLTHALNGNSPVVDAGTNTSCQSPDQRGTSRPNDGNGDGAATCDIGAVEATVFALTVNKTGSGASTGTVAGSGINCGPACQRTYAAGRTVALIPANTGATFISWAGACSGAVACQPIMDNEKIVTAEFQRINVGVSVTRPNPQPPTPFLTSILSARSGCGPIVQILFGNNGQPFDNAVVTVTTPAGGPGPKDVGFLYVPPTNTTSVALTIHRVTQAGGATVKPIRFFDGCGEWQTFVGGGPGAFAVP